MKRINILITDEQHKKLLETSEKQEVSISEQIRNSINNYLFSNFIDNSLHEMFASISIEDAVKSIIVIDEGKFKHEISKCKFEKDKK